MTHLLRRSWIKVICSAADRNRSRPLNLNWDQTSSVAVLWTGLTDLRLQHMYDQEEGCYFLLRRTADVVVFCSPWWRLWLKECRLSDAFGFIFFSLMVCSHQCFSQLVHSNCSMLRSRSDLLVLLVFSLVDRSLHGDGKHVIRCAQLQFPEMSVGHRLSVRCVASCGRSQILLQLSVVWTWSSVEMFSLLTEKMLSDIELSVCSCFGCYSSSTSFEVFKVIVWCFGK